MPRVKMHHNPFFNLLVLVGIAFCLSVWLTYLASLRTATLEITPDSGVRGETLVMLFQHHAVAVLAVELLMLAACAAAAIATDKYWSARPEAHYRRPGHGAKPRPPD